MGERHGVPEIAEPGQFIFTLKDETHYSLESFSKSGYANDAAVYPLDDTVQFHDFKICINRIYDRAIKPYIGVPFLLNIKDVQSVAGSYISQLTVEWRKGAGIINLGLTGTNSKKEIDFLNGLINAYRARDLENKNETAERTIEFIRDQLSGIKDSLRIVEFQLERFGNSSRIKDMSAEAQRLFTKAEAFEVQKAELLIRQNYYQYLDDYIVKNEGNFDQIILPSSIGISDPVLNSLLPNVDLRWR